jgi:hypothetical protein
MASCRRAKLQPISGLYREWETPKGGVSGILTGDGQRRPPPMSKSKNKKKPPKRVLGLPNLEQSKSAVLNSLTSKSGQRT